MQVADFLTVDEKRAAVGYGAIEGGDGFGLSPPPCHDRFLIFIRGGFTMALRLTPPTKNVFYLSTLCAIVAVVLYLLGVLGVIEPGFPAVVVAFWIAMLAWALMTAGVALKGV